MHEHPHPLTTDLRVALWGFEGAEKEAGQSCALIPVCSADWDTAVDG